MEWDPKTALLSPLMPSLASTPKAFTIFCKRISTLMATPDRQKLAFGMFERILEQFCLGCGTGDSDWKTTLFTVQFFYMLHVFTLGWDECEFPQLLTRIDRNFGLSRKMNR